jgi:hypothetical protein
MALVYNATCIPGISSIHLRYFTNFDRGLVEIYHILPAAALTGLPLSVGIQCFHQDFGATVVCLISELSQPPPDIYIYPPDERRVVGINHVLPIPTFNNLNASKLRD